jgi:hypothetical protein
MISIPIETIPIKALFHFFSLPDMIEEVSSESGKANSVVFNSPKANYYFLGL